MNASDCCSAHGSAPPDVRPCCDLRGTSKPDVRSSAVVILRGRGSQVSRRVKASAGVVNNGASRDSLFLTQRCAYAHGTAFLTPGRKGQFGHKQYPAKNQGSAATARCRTATSCALSGAHSSSRAVRGEPGSAPRPTAGEHERSGELVTLRVNKM